MEVLEEDLCFTSGGLSKRNDMDASPGLRVNDGNRYAFKQSEGNEALFLVMKPIVFEGVSRAFKHPFHVNKIETVALRGFMRKVRLTAEFGIIFRTPVLLRARVLQGLPRKVTTAQRQCL